MSSFWRKSMTTLQPLRRLLSSATSSSGALSPTPLRMSWRPQSIRFDQREGIPVEPGPTRPAPKPTMPIPKWEEDPRGEPIKLAKARKLGIAISHRKLNLVARLIRGLPVPEAYRQLAALNKKAAPIISSVLRAAVRNAQTYGLKDERLTVHEAYVGKGVYLKRIRPWHGKGRHGVHHKKYAHMTIIVRELDDELWELTVLPQYYHLKRGKVQDDSSHPIHQSDKVSWVSDLDKGLAMANENIRILRRQLTTDIRTPSSV